MLITGFLWCTHAIDKFELLSPAQRHHTKTYATGCVVVVLRGSFCEARAVQSMDG